MRKVLVILLIAVIACSEIAEIKDTELGIKGIIDDLKQKAIKFFKKHNIYNRILSLLKESGPVAAISLCIKVTSSGLCNSYVNAVKC